MKRVLAAYATTVLAALVVVIVAAANFGAATTPTTAPQGVGLFEYGPTDVTSSGLRDIGTEYVVRTGFGREAVIGFAVEVNTGGLDDFAVLVKYHPNDVWHTEYSGTDWDTLHDNLVRVGPIAPNDLADGETTFAVLRIPVYAIKFAAQSSDGSDVTVRGVFTNR